MRCNGKIQLKQLTFVVVKYAVYILTHLLTHFINIFQRTGAQYINQDAVTLIFL